MAGKSQAIKCAIKEYRRRKGLSQDQLALLVGLRRQAVYDLESGRYLPNTAVALRLARILGCTVEMLFVEEAQAEFESVLNDAEAVTGRLFPAKMREKLAGGLKDCGAAVFCGGRDRRLLGADRALYLIDQTGRGLLSALAGELAERFGEVVLVTDDRRKLTSFAELRTFTVVEDLRPGTGPVGAILTALTHLPGRPVFVLACDMPVIEWVVIERLRHLMETAGAQAALPRHEGRLEPLHAFYSPGAIPVFAQGLDEGHSSIRGNLNRMTAVFWDCPNPGPASRPTLGLFPNLNTLDEARRAGFSLLGQTNRPALTSGSDGPIDVLAETVFELAVDGETIVTQVALPTNLDDLARGLLLAKGLIDGADDLASLLVSADRRRVEAELKSIRHKRPKVRKKSRPVWVSCEVAAMFEKFESQTSPWQAAGAVDRASFAVAGAKEGGQIFEDLTPLAAMDKALGRILISRDDHGQVLILTNHRAGRETVERVLRVGAAGLVTRLRPTAEAVDLARASDLFLATMDSGRSGLSIYAGEASIN
jgi:formate dehydrogenase accessory protein FdhD